MKIQSLYFDAVGPLQNREIHFTDDWSGQPHGRVLLSGPNGCGKSTVLRAVAALWQAAAHWLDRGQTLPRPSPVREWLQRWGGVAVVFTDAAFLDDPSARFGLYFGDQTWIDALRQRMKGFDQVQWLGETVQRTGQRGNPTRKLVRPAAPWVDRLTAARRKMVVDFQDTPLPNIVHLDAEERRWVSPRKRLGEFLPEQASNRWLPRYEATDDWDGQLEASLINLKLTNEKRFQKVLAVLNRFLHGKQIDPVIAEGSNRLQVRMARGTSRKPFIGIDDLSAGEHQVLIMLFLVARWAERGAIVMIDEPDLYLHPSLVGVLLASVEQLVDNLGGQLLLTSHLPSVWQRYETTGLRHELAMEDARDQG